MRPRFVLVVGLLAVALTGCRAPRLRAAMDLTAPITAATAAAAPSDARRLAAPLLAGPEGRPQGMGEARVDEDAVRIAERAMDLRREAFRPRASDCSPMARARTLEAPTGRGDEYTGSGAALGLLIHGLKWLLEGAKVR